MLCDLINCIRPGSVPRVHRELNHELQERANIELYLAACASIGLPHSDLFLMPDLHSHKSYNAVIEHIYALGGFVQRTPHYNGPRLGRVKVDLDAAQRRRHEQELEAAEQATQRQQKRSGPRKVVMRGDKELFGLDAELELRARASYTREEVAAVATWISLLTNEKVIRSAVEDACARVCSQCSLNATALLSLAKRCEAASCFAR